MPSCAHKFNLTMTVMLNRNIVLKTYSFSALVIASEYHSNFSRLKIGADWDELTEQFKVRGRQERTQHQGTNNLDKSWKDSESQTPAPHLYRRGRAGKVFELSLSVSIFSLQDLSHNDTSRSLFTCLMRRHRRGQLMWKNLWGFNVIVTPHNVAS